MKTMPDSLLNFYEVRNENYVEPPLGCASRTEQFLEL